MPLLPSPMFADHTTTGRNRHVTKETCSNTDDDNERSHSNTDDNSNKDA
jgi:hypothetical protein